MAKTCPACLQSKPFDDYYRRKRADQYPNTDAGYQTVCKDCFKGSRAEYVKLNKAKCLEQDRVQYLKNPDRYRSRNYEKNFGITLKDYNELFQKQEGKCGGCERHQTEFKRRLAVDHCHKTGVIRGLLCHFCNRALGLVLDNEKTLINLSNYVTNFPTLTDNNINVVSINTTKRVG